MHITAFGRNMNQNFKPAPEVIQLFSYSTQLSTKFILPINVKMPTIVGILTFIGMTNTTSKRLKARNFFIFRYFSFYEQLKFRGKWSLAWKKLYNLRARTVKLDILFSCTPDKDIWDLPWGRKSYLTYAILPRTSSNVIMWNCILAYSGTSGSSF